MGYFSNGTEGESYEARYCAKCIHNENEKMGCPVMAVHVFYNYDECNNDKSILDMLIPRLENGLGNKQCRMFHESTND